MSDPTQVIKAPAQAAQLQYLKARLRMQAGEYRELCEQVVKRSCDDHLTSLALRAIKTLDRGLRS